MPVDVSFPVAIAALFLGVLALLVAAGAAAHRGGQRWPWLALGLMFLAVSVVVLVAGA